MENSLRPWTLENDVSISHQIQGLSIIDVAMHWVELCPYTSKISPCSWIRIGFTDTRILELPFLTMALSSHMNFWSYDVAMASLSNLRP